MNAVILYLSGRTIRAVKMKQPANPIRLDSGTFSHENFYFGDWIPLRNSARQIVGFKIVPFAKDDYIEERILPAKFIRLATNVSLERAGKYTYVSIFLAETQAFEEDTVNSIEAAVFHNQHDDFIVRLDGFRNEDWSQLGFELPEMLTPVTCGNED